MAHSFTACSPAGMSRQKNVAANGLLIPEVLCIFVIRDGKTNLWALREKAGFLQSGSHEPTQLTAGPLNFSNPLPSRDGKRLFAVGQQLRGGLVRYDAKTKQLLSYIYGISATHLDFSGDGEWVCFASLILSSACGEASWTAVNIFRLRIFLQCELAGPRWSPDGKKIAFLNMQTGKPWKLYFVFKF